MRIKTQGANANQNATKNIATHSSSTRVEWRFDRSATGLAMRCFRAALLMAAIAMAGVCSQAHALDANLLPKYGLQPKTEVQKAADANFIAAMDAQYKGDRKKAADEASNRGWQLLRQGNPPDAMRRFNQAWLLNANNGGALWGMAVIQGQMGQLDQALKLFAEAKSVLGDDIDLAADHARALGAAGTKSNNRALMNQAFAQFAWVHQKAPQHTLNLQNWAIAHFYLGNYAEAWAKIKLAEATTRRAEIDPNFVAALQSKMPRP